MSIRIENREENLIMQLCFGLLSGVRFYEPFLKVALQILGRKFYINTKKNHPYTPKSLLIFIHKTPTVENHPTTREIRELLRPRSTPTGITVFFLHEQLAHLHTGNTQKKVSNIAPDEDIMENNIMIVM